MLLEKRGDTLNLDGIAFLPELGAKLINTHSGMMYQLNKNDHRLSIRG
jgi:hypothetical protein